MAEETFRQESRLRAALHVARTVGQDIQSIQAAASSEESESIGWFSFFFMLLVASALDAINVITLGIVGWLIPGIPGSLLLAGIMLMAKGWSGQLYGKVGLGLVLGCVPVLCIAPWRSGMIIYENIDKLSKALDLGATVAKYAKYVVGPEAAIVERGLRKASQVAEVAQSVKSRDLRGAALKAAVLKQQMAGTQRESEPRSAS